MAIKTKILLIALPLTLLLGFVAFYHLFPETIFTLLVRADRSASGLAEHRIQVDGLQFAYLERGAGDVLLLLHGFGANKDNWVRISRHLTPHFRVIAPDLIGFGESDLAPDNDYSIRAQVVRVRQFVRALGIKGLHLGGSSMGGYIAGVYASLYPDELHSLVLIAPGGVAAAEPSEMIQRLTEGESVPLLVADMADYDRLLDFIFSNRPFIPGPVKRTLAKDAIARRPHYLAIWNQLLGSLDVQPLEDRVRGLTVPTLVVWGARDRVLHVSGAEILTAAMPNARAAVLDAVGHLPMIEKPEETARVYLNFRGQGANP
jgi:pimeloyl-ACP methyl ester carboxylesterase